MEEELNIIKQMGAVTSKEIEVLISKNRRNTINGLNRLEKFGEIEIMVFKAKQNNRRVYVTKKLYDNTIKATISNR